MVFSIDVPQEYFDADHSKAMPSQNPLLNLSWGKNKRLAPMIVPWAPPTERIVPFSAQVDIGVVKLGQATPDATSIVSRMCETKLKLGSLGGPIYKIQLPNFPSRE